MDKEQLISKIRAYVYQNDKNEITGQGLQDLLEDIVDTSFINIDDIQDEIEVIQKDIAKTNEDISATNLAISNIGSDNILNAGEKPAERLRWNGIFNEKSGIDAQADLYAITTEKTNYDNAFQSLANYLNAGTTWTEGVPSWVADNNISFDTAIIGSIYRTNWNAFYTAKQTLLNAIYAKIKTLINAVQQAVESAQNSANSASEKADAAQNSANSAINAANSAQNAANSAQNYIKNVLPDKIGDLQNQIDGVVDSWFYAYTPTGSNVPASDWTTDALKSQHVGDTFTNTQAFVDNTTTPDAGKSWRWVVNNSVYFWTPISDSDAVKALLVASTAQDTADEKRRIFVAQPTTPYDVGDMWTQGTTGDIMRCATGRLTGNFNTSDWVKASKYTDDTYAKTAQNLSPDSTDWDKMVLKSDFNELFEKVNLSTPDTPAYAIHAKLPLYTEGGLTAYGKGTSGTGGGSIDDTILWSILGNTGNEQIATNHLANALTPYALAANIPTKLSQLSNDAGFVTDSIVNGYATELWCNTEFAPVSHKHAWADITDHPTSLPASDVYSWAKAASKPAYAFSEIGGKPTTLNGYGIADAAAAVHKHVWTDITDHPTSLPAEDVYDWAKASVKPNYAFSEIGSKPTTLDGFGITDAAAANHTHTISQITDLANASVSYANTAGNAGNADKLNGLGISSFITDAGGNYSGTLHNLACKSIFSGNNISDGPTQGWISGIVLGDNWNSNHYQKYIVASGDDLYYGNTNNPPSWFKVLTSNNYNSYVPTLTGAGASGNWGINAQHLLINNATWASNWYWDGQGSQPTWLWGSNDGATMYVWNPSNFNVASATRLQTARNIFGIAFDGTGDANGIFRSLLNDSANGSVVHKILNYTSAPYGLETRIYNTGAVSLQSQRESNDGETFPFILNPNGGNVGIGTTAPTSRLHVVGDILAEGRIKIGNITLINDGAGSLYIQKSDGTKANLLVTGGMSCYNNTI